VWGLLEKLCKRVAVSDAAETTENVTNDPVHAGSVGDCDHFPTKIRDFNAFRTIPLQTLRAKTKTNYY
jgi:hypothetical protein